MRRRRTDRPTRSSWLPAALLLAVASCAPPPAPPVQLATFEALTSGSPEELLGHLQTLDAQWENVSSPDPDSARSNLGRFNEAVRQTCNAVLENPQATEPQRLRAAEGLFRSWISQIEVDQEKAVEGLKADVERLAKMAPNTALSTMAAYYRVFGLNELARIGLGDPDELARRRVDAALVLGRAEPPDPNAPDILKQSARDAEKVGLDEKARELFMLVAERYPDDEGAGLSRAAAERLAGKGKPVEGLAGDGPDGKPVDLKDFRGKVVLVHFWSAGHVPSRQETSQLASLQKEWGPRGLAILGVTFDPPGGERYQDYLKNLGVDWPQILSPGDDEKKVLPPMALKFGILEVPFKLVIDREGNLVGSASTLEEARAMIEPLLEPVVGAPASEAAKAPA